jgi:membrane protein DedA with SNARE-associated domain
VPAVRQLISIPAGLSKMNIRNFILYTTAGAGIWNIILAVIGYFIYDIRDRIFPYIEYILYFLGAVFIIYLVFKSFKNRKARRRSDL